MKLNTLYKSVYSSMPYIMLLYSSDLFRHLDHFIWLDTAIAYVRYACCRSLVDDNGANTTCSAGHADVCRRFRHVEHRCVCQ